MTIFVYRSHAPLDCKTCYEFAGWGKSSDQSGIGWHVTYKLVSETVLGLVSCWVTWTRMSSLGALPKHSSVPVVGRINSHIIIRIPNVETLHSTVECRVSICSPVEYTVLHGLLWTNSITGTAIRLDLVLQMSEGFGAEYWSS